METLRKAINKAIKNNITFYAYRLPDDRLYHFSAPITSQTYESEGFKVSPFDDFRLPSVFIHKGLNAYDFCNCGTDFCIKASTESISDFSETTRKEYASSFQQCMKALRNGSLEKIVLSKVIKCEYPTIDWGLAFQQMAEKYPQAFIFIFNAQETGAWAGASPETLARFHDSQFSTMALAGTRLAADNDKEWGIKEIQEQGYVADYIEDIFLRNGITYTKFPRTTLTAGRVAHLCNRFAANVVSMSAAELLVSELHPTPALCGLPTAIARTVISEIESHPRMYYGGYLGPVTSSGFDYFVNLRSLTFDKDSQILFCGGGLTVDSDEDSEWSETEAKSQTMKTILYSSKV